jgi:phosphoribosylformylglycinamidine synthase
VEQGLPPAVDLEHERRLAALLRELVAGGLVSAAHDVADGGLAVALAEMALAGGIGAEVEAHPRFSLAGWWFGEEQGRYLITVPDVAAFQAQLAKGTRDADSASSGLRRIGTVGGNSLFGVFLADLREASDSFFRDWMEV